MRKWRHLVVPVLFWTVLAGCNSRSKSHDANNHAGPSTSVDSKHETTTGAETTGSTPPTSAPVTPLPTIATQLTERRALASRKLLEPFNDGWMTEAIAEAATSHLETLGRALRLESEVRLDQLKDLVAEDIRTTALRPTNLIELFRDSMIHVRRQVSAPKTDAEHLGRVRLNGAIDDLIRPITTPALIDSHFKVVGVHRGPDSIETKVLVELDCHDNKSAQQINATWDCTWRQIDRDKLVLSSLTVTDYEETTLQNVDGRWFSDCTSAVVGNDTALWQQLAHGHHYWLQRIERVQRFDTSVRNGLAVGDVNGDGLDDVYLCQPPGLPNRLFVHQPDGTAIERAAAAGVDWLDQTSAVLLCDLDNDDDQDLVLGTHVGILLMQNNGQGMFQLTSKLELDYDVQSLSAVDYDNDGRLDLFACVYRTTNLPASSFLYRDAVGGGKNRLFRNEISSDGWKFADVTTSVGLDDGADRYSLAASWEDFDNDGDQDLYVANDFGRNHLYENRGGKFIDVAAQAGVLDIGSGMSVSWADHNRDGLMDLYVGNMFSSAGQRVTSQQKFRATEAEEIRKIYQRLAKGNSLFTNQGDGTFTETGQQAGVELGRWAWSSLFVDLNNDGWEDLLVANGYMTTPDTADL